MVLAVTEPSGRYQYPAEVKFEIRQNVKADYARTAEFVNFSQARLVLIQHEYGIFGGDDGIYILELIHALRVPSMVTLHTVLRRPSERQLAIVRRFAERCEAIVVMSQVAAKLLGRAHGVPASKVRIIPHGIPVMDPQADRLALKAKFGVGDQPLLLTFGLLSANKGIETVIRALPAVVKAFPKLVYLIVGATHPAVLRREGEAYRTMLEREAEELGVREHVAFRSQYVSDGELLQYLQAADIFVSPYLNEQQVTSGALSYAMGAGAAVVSTPYWHAQELLSEGRGYLFPFRDHAALGQTLLQLLASSEVFGRARKSASDFGYLAREMLGRALPHACRLGPRGTALTILGLVELLRFDSAAERAVLRDARESLEFLEDVCFDKGQLHVVGNTGGHSRGGEKACADEQAIAAAAFVLAFRCAYRITRDRHYLLRMREAFAWFLGANRLGVPECDDAPS
jgi:glycosyltransferase involved in cell wall biosynthesis